MGVDGSKELGQIDSAAARFAKGIPRVARGKLIARWRKRQLPLQLFAVVRHVERADGAYAFVQGGARWSQTEDFRQWPLDPPISDGGMEAVQVLAQKVRGFAESTSSQIHVVICSPYYRCIQTAVEICRELGPKVRMLIDRGIGEVYGPAIMGPNEPTCPVRPIDQTHAFCRSRGVVCHSKLIGKWPTWPEDLKAARLRYANRFLTYLQRSAVTRRNFIMVTHADCVGSALSMMPSQADHAVQSIEYGGTFVAKRVRSDNASSEKSRRRSLPRNFSSVCPSSTGSQDSDASYLADCDSPTDWETHSDTFGSPKVDNWLAEEPTAGDLVKNGSEEALDGAPLEIPQASDGWQVLTHQINLVKKAVKGTPPSRKSSKSTIFTKKVKSLAKNGPFTREQISKLLGELSDKPLGGGDDEFELNSVRNNHNNTTTTLTSFPTQLSLSTFLFGASDVANMSDCGSALDSLATNSRMPTYQEMGDFDLNATVSSTEDAQRILATRSSRRSGSRWSDSSGTGRDSPRARHKSPLLSGSSLGANRRKLSQESSEESSHSDKSPGSGKRTGTLTKVAESAQWSNFEDPVSISRELSGGSSSGGSAGGLFPARSSSLNANAIVTMTGPKPAGDERKPGNSMVVVNSPKPIGDDRKAVPLKSFEGSTLLRRRNMKLTLHTGPSEVGLPSDIVQEQDTPGSSPAQQQVEPARQRLSALGASAIEEAQTSTDRALMPLLLSTNAETHS
mmetsp:Transcript_107044/g.194822  ORF Transcript_107044/g.194822 Transcript_107044/m.194822 type:complete len:734 (-) Transcript_107044:99-2300(-)